MRPFVVVLLLISTWVLVSGFVCSQRPDAVHIAAIFTFNSVIGRVAKPAIEAAVSDINADSSILNGTKLRLIAEDANCSVFLGSVEAFQVLEREVVAIIGPQSSAIAHIISGIANGLQVPLISYAATEPTLSSLKFPFFLRTTPSDAYQMAAMASLIEFYGWREVIVIFVDDDYGRNGIAALDDELEKKKLRISYKLPLPTQYNLSDIAILLNNSKLLGPRVYVVHINPDPELKFFTVAKQLQMMTSGYVWFATDWLSTTIDSFFPMNQTSLVVLHGVVTLRQRIPKSKRKQAFLSRWRTLQKKGIAISEMNIYGLYAYDSVWAVAHSIDKFINQYKNVSFSFDNKLLDMKTTEIQLQKLKVFDGGSILLSKLLETNFSGVTGRVRFDQDRNRVAGGYDVININRMATQTVGFWSNYTGFSVSPPETLEKNSDSQLDQKLKNVTWPGGETNTPRGWVIADDEKPLRIGVPKRTSFVEFVSEYSNHEIRGYCTDIFIAARKLLPYEVPYKFVPYGDGHSNPKYDELVRMVSNNVFDAAVGDITIVKNRTTIVDFSQPYATTGLVIVAPVSHQESNAWVFLKPFTWEMWTVTIASFFFVGIVIWVLEHRVNDDFRGPPKRQIVTMLLFSFSTLFKRNQVDTVSSLGRMVMVVWLFLLMVISSSYTASLTTILTVQQLSSPITGIDSLIATNWPIGYQVGSFAYNYLTEILYIPKARLISLRSPEEYENALRLGPYNGGAAAIIDELPYVELFLSERTDFGIIGPAITRSGWGFAFQRDSPLAIDMSTAILKLSESGKLQEIYQKWFCKTGCPDEQGQDSKANQLKLISFWGLYLLSGGFALGALLIFFLRMVYQFVRYSRRQTSLPSPLPSISSSSQCSHVFQSFIDFVDEKEESIKKMFARPESPQAQAAD
ncbi:hypothetical protein UlMin_022914 [Ulmus minor]